MNRKTKIIFSLTLIITALHYLTPASPEWHGLHIVFRKLYLLPIVLAAAWLSFKGVVYVLVGCSILYGFHVITHWGGHGVENLNQAGELFSMWFVGIMAGWLEQLARNSRKREKDAYKQSLFALAHTVELREYETGVHSERVAEYANIVAEKMNLSDDVIERVDMGAMLHDIGKVGIPDSILLKKGRLTSEEWEIMRRHPSLAKELIQDVDFLQPAINTAEYHHERFDGKGYPHGLKGENIPIEARIFSVVDSFDAMTSDRPYRKGIPIDDAIEEIRHCSGTQFDPAVVEAFLSIELVVWEKIRSKF